MTWYLVLSCHHCVMAVSSSGHKENALCPSNYFHFLRSFKKFMHSIYVVGFDSSLFVRFSVVLLVFQLNHYENNNIFSLLFMRVVCMRCFIAFEQWKLDKRKEIFAEVCHFHYLIFFSLYFVCPQMLNRFNFSIISSNNHSLLHHRIVYIFVMPTLSLCGLV